MKAESFSIPTGWKEVSKQAFFGFIGPQNVNPHSEKLNCTWQLTNRQVIGYSAPGYMCRDVAGNYVSEKFYFLKES